MQWYTHQQVSKYDPATRTKGIGVGRDDPMCRSHRIDSSDLRRGDLGGSRTAWRSALRGRRSLWWWWRRVVARRAKSLGIRSVPAVVIDGKLADCCAGRGVDETVLRAAGLGRAL